ncbi:MAG: DUF5682 family protein [Gammaproteobacteria bacterium]
MRDWRALFRDVFSYCAMARCGYEATVLEAEGSLARERHMAAHIRRWRAQVDGPVVVVTGGFHTLALQQMLAAPYEAPAPPPPRKRLGQWLIRYSFDRLDALNGYGAGMPAPAFYQRVWDSAQGADGAPRLVDVAVECLTALAQQSRALGLPESMSTAAVQAAALQAVRLADLRGHPGPGRDDLLDAIRSCFIKGAVDDGANGLTADIRRLLGGSRLGDIPPSAGSPPLLEDARRLATANGIRLDDSGARTVRLDLYRNGRHRQRSRFLHLMAYLETGLAQHLSGPDFVAGSALELLTEQWKVNWNPLVEARLIERSGEGTTLAQVALARLRAQEDALAAQGQARSARHAARLLTRACLIGMQERLPQLLAMLAAHLHEDANPASVIACAEQLLTLWRAREPLGVQEHPQLHDLLLQAHACALYLMPQLGDARLEDEADAIASLLALRTLNDALAAADGDTWLAQLERLVAADAAPGVASAAAALLYLDGRWNEDQLTGHLVGCFGAGAVAADAVRALKGMMTAAPELLLTQARLRDAFGALMAGWDEASFTAFLPDLRQAFTHLKPIETARLAELLAGGEPIALAAMQYDVSEADMLAGAALALAFALARDGLADWSARV